MRHVDRRVLRKSSDRAAEPKDLVSSRSYRDRAQRPCYGHEPSGRLERSECAHMRVECAAACPERIRSSDCHPALRIPLNGLSREVESHDAGLAEARVQQNRGREMMGAQRVLDVEDFANMFVAIRVGRQVSARTAPEVELVVIPEVSDATHLQGMRCRIEPDRYTVAEKFLCTFPDSWLLAWSSTVVPRARPRRHDSTLCVTGGHCFGDPLRLECTRAVLDERRHRTAPIASRSRAAVINRRAG